MRLASLVATGLMLGAGSGFLAALLRPRSQHAYRAQPPDGEPDDDAPGPSAGADPDVAPAAHDELDDVLDPARNGEQVTAG